MLHSHRFAWALLTPLLLAAACTFSPNPDPTNPPLTSASSSSSSGLAGAGGMAGAAGMAGTGGIAGTGGMAGAGGSMANAPKPDFALADVNPNSATFGKTVSPHDYLGRVSAWYFGHAT